MLGKQRIFDPGDQTFPKNNVRWFQIAHGNDGHGSVEIVDFRHMSGAQRAVTL